MLHHACEPTHPEPTSQDTTNFRSENFHITHPCFELCRNRLHHACVPTHPEPTFQRHTTKPDTKIFISHIPLLNFAGATLPYYTKHVCQTWTNVPKIHRKTSDPKIFISHICFALCRSSSPCYTRHVSQPILNQRPKTHYKLQIRKFSSQTSCFELCRNRLYYACVPTHPEPTFQRHTTKPRPQDFHLTHPSF